MHTLSRRSILKAAAGIAAGLTLPPTLEENAEAARRFTIQLDRTMMPRPQKAWETRSFEDLRVYGLEPGQIWVQSDTLVLGGLRLHPKRATGTIRIFRDPAQGISIG